MTHPRLARPVQSVNWSDFAPTDWVTTLPFSTSVTASSSVNQEMSADAYSVSTDGGATWSAWSTDGLSTQVPISTMHNLTVNNLALPDSASLNYIRYRVMETGGVEAISPHYLVHVDATAPGPPRKLGR